MPAKNQVTVTLKPTTRRPTSLERREAQTAILATQQARLKQEAADRRLNADKTVDTTPSEPRPHRQVPR